MCRNIHTLYHVNPPATQEDIQLAALQFVRKISGYHKPSKANEAAFMAAVDDITTACIRLMDTLETSAPLREHSVVIKTNSTQTQAV